MNHRIDKSDLNFAVSLRGFDMQFSSTWGLFSPKSIDEGTLLLINQLQIPANAVVLDLGCGYGPLGLVAARLAPTGHVDLVDKDFMAIEYSSKNAALNGISNTTAFLSNGLDQIPADRKYDVIVSNIPAKIGNELLAIFLRDSYEHLNPGGQFYAVTISGLKDYMKRNLSEAFGNYKKLKQSNTYTAALAIKQ